MSLNQKVTKRFFLIAFAVIIGSASLILRAFKNQNESQVKFYSLQFAYPVQSLNPLIYDDWSSVFVGNHIYARLLPETDRPWIKYVAHHWTASCETYDSNSKECSRQRIEITFQPLIDCGGRELPIDQIQDEFFQILKAKKWILPTWKKCEESSPNGACVTTLGRIDIERRLRSIAFRFGWSRLNLDAKSLGTGPYCLSETEVTKGKIAAGKLAADSARERKLPVARFFTSQSKDSKFDLALYGSNSLLTQERKNLQPHTPLPYYVVSRPGLTDADAPWRSRESIALIKQHLMKVGIVYDAPQEILSLVPQGKQPAEAIRKLHHTFLSRNFLIPDYIPECQNLAAKLNRLWQDSKLAHANCGDLVAFIMNRVWKSQKWYGFLVSLSPSSLGKTAISDQYFSPFSGESFTGLERHPEDCFTLVAMGQSIVTVSESHVCNLRPNALGLSDLVLTDIMPCSEAI